MKRLTLLFSLLASFCALATPAAAAQESAPPLLQPHRVTLANGRSFELNLPPGFALSVAAEGLRRVRFMAVSPDQRVFATGMYNLTDNRRGAVYILDDFDPAAGKFQRVIPFLTNLRNPNSVAFYTDRAGVHWLYLALTDRLLRYRYRGGENAPADAPEVLATFPDYGLSYKYGGWHLTRTIEIGGDKIYVSVGSSCNACEETEEVRASVLEMDPDGGRQRHYVRGLRNAVGLRWAEGQLFATNMGADHLGDRRPADTMYALREGAHYGWPYCYQAGAKIYPDAKLNPRGKRMNCGAVPRARAVFAAHSSPLGLEFFGADAPPELQNSFLVALHGSTKRALGRGYRLVRVRAGEPVDFMTGFQRSGRVHGRPAGLLKYGEQSFLLTDDHAGVVYYIYRRPRAEETRHRAPDAQP